MFWLLKFVIVLTKIIYGQTRNFTVNIKPENIKKTNLIWLSRLYFRYKEFLQLNMANNPPKCINSFRYAPVIIFKKN